MLYTGGLAEYAIKTEFYGINFNDRTFHCNGDGKQFNTFTSLRDVGKCIVAILNALPSQRTPTSLFLHLIVITFL